MNDFNVLKRLSDSLRDEWFQQPDRFFSIFAAQIDARFGFLRKKFRSLRCFAHWLLLLCTLNRFQLRELNTHLHRTHRYKCIVIFYFEYFARLTGILRESYARAGNDRSILGWFRFARNSWCFNCLSLRFEFYTLRSDDFFRS